MRDRTQPEGGARKAELTPGWGEQLVSSSNRISKGEARHVWKQSSLKRELIQLLKDFNGFWKPQKKTTNQLTVDMDEEAVPLLTPQAESQIRVRHLWFFLVAGLLVLVVAYCLFINNIFHLHTFKCPVDQLVNCGTKIEKSRWITRCCPAWDPVAWYVVKTQ